MLRHAKVYFVSPESKPVSMDILRGEESALSDWRRRVGGYVMYQIFQLDAEGPRVGGTRNSRQRTRLWDLIRPSLCSLTTDITGPDSRRLLGPSPAELGGVDGWVRREHGLWWEWVEIKLKIMELVPRLKWIVAAE